MSLKLYPFQRRGINKLHKWNGRALLADEQGLGKTLQALMFIKEHPEQSPVIIVCPASVKYNWQAEGEKHLGMWMDVAEGTKPPAGGMHSPKIVCLNYDILYAWVDYLRELGPKLVVLDESQHLGSRSSRRTKAAKALCRGVPHVIALSGTPLTNRPAELWPTLNIVRPDLYPSFYPYANAHCKPKQIYGRWTFNGAHDLETLHKNLRKTLMIRRLKEDVLEDLPSKRKSVVLLDIERREEYRRALNDFVGWMREENPGKVNRARKAEGLVKIGYLKRLVADLKMKSVFAWVDDFLAGGDGKLVLFAEHRKIVRALHERYEKMSCFIDGSVKGRERQETVQRFQTNRKVRIFVGNKAAEAGITLTAASDLAHVEFPWTPGSLDQRSDRVHRLTQTSSVMISYLTARDTMEGHLIQVLSKKAKVVRAVLDGGGAGDFDIYDELTRLMREGK